MLLNETSEMMGMSGLKLANLAWREACLKNLDVDGDLLEGKQHQKRNHETEQSHRLGQGKPEDRVREHLLLEGRIAGVPGDERRKHRPDADSCEAGVSVWGCNVQVMMSDAKRKTKNFYYKKKVRKCLPDPATPTVAAPAPMNFAAESISRVTCDVWNDRTWGSSATGVLFCAARVWLWLMTALLNGRR